MKYSIVSIVLLHFNSFRSFGFGLQGNVCLLGVLSLEKLLGTWWAGACFAGHEDQNCASSTNSRGELVGVNEIDLTWQHLLTLGRSSSLLELQILWFLYEHWHLERYAKRKHRGSVQIAPPWSSSIKSDMSCNISWFFKELNMVRVGRCRKFVGSFCEDSQWIQQSFDAVFPPEAPLDRNAFPGVAKAQWLQWLLSDCYTFSQRVGQHGNCVHHVSWCSCDEWSEHSLSTSETQPHQAVQILHRVRRVPCVPFEYWLLDVPLLIDYNAIPQDGMRSWNRQSDIGTNV